MGSTSLTTDNNGDIVSEVRYLPYGQERWNNGASITDFGFTAQCKDSYIKLYDYGARWYDPQIGRFISPGTIIPNPANPQSWNRYAYVFNNPVNYTDPSGHCPPSICRNFGGTPADPYYRWGDVGYLNTLPLGGPNPWFVPQPSNDAGQIPSFKETTRNIEYALLPEEWHDELAAFHEWGDRWGPSIEYGLSIAMMTAGPAPSKAGVAELKFFELESGPHLSVIVKYGDEVLETHQTNLSKVLTYLKKHRAYQNLPLQRNFSCQMQKPHRFCNES